MSNEKQTEIHDSHCYKNLLNVICGINTLAHNEKIQK